MSALGETFRAARESQGLSLTELAERIHIRTVYLMAIESEDWATIGPPVYVRGFLRTYARALGLDGDAAVAQFAQTSAGAIPTPPPRTEPARSGGQRADAERRDAARKDAGRRGGLSTGALVGLIVALLFVAFVGYQAYDYWRTRAVAVNVVDPAPASEAPAQPSPATAVFDDRAVAKPLPKVDNHPRFALRLRGASWLRVTVDGKVALEGTFPKGTTRAFAGRSATIRAGNAGGVDLSLNGKDLGPMGGLGDVAERSFRL